MTTQFGSLWLDLLAAALAGLAGGFGLGLLQESGVELPRVRRKTETAGETEVTVTHYFDFGFLADMLVGSIAALIVYALNTPASQLQLLGVGLTAGLGGAGILKGYVQAQRNQELSGLAQEALTLARMESGAAPVPAPGAGGGEGEPVDLRVAEPPVRVQQQRIEVIQQRVDELTKKAR